MRITRYRLITAGLIIASAITFGIAAAVERNGAHHEARPSAAVTTPDADAGHGGGTDAEGGKAPAEGDTHGTTRDSGTGAGEHILGVNPEATTLVLAAVIGSAVLAAALLLVASPLLAALVGLAMAAFAALDVREVVHQFGESHSGLAVLAIVVAALHLLAVGGAFVIIRTTARTESAWT